MYSQSSLRAAIADNIAETRQTEQASRVSTASANLTNYVQEYVVTLDQKWLQKYWDEVDAGNKADAIKQLKEMNVPQEELDLVNEGIANSDNLVNLETRSQRLILDSLGTPTENMPQAVAAWKVSPEDAALTPEAKQSLARELIFGDLYNEEVAKIMTPIDESNTKMVNRLNAQIASSNASLTASLWVLSIVAILLTVLSMSLLAVFNRTTARPIQQYRTILESTDPKDLTVQLRAMGVVETKDLANVINSKNRSIGELIGTIMNSAGILNHETTSIEGSANHMDTSTQQSAAKAEQTAQSAAEVSASIATVAAASEEMGASIREISSNATHAAEVANDAMKVAERTTDIVAKLSESSKRIGEVIASITQIAEQTNLLALNATIEAARAGEAGKGFAVVAGEVKDLAAQTGTATSDISARVISIQEDTAAAEQALSEITDVINRINETQTVIAAAVEEQTATVNEISHSVQSAAEGSQEIAGAVGEIANAAGDNSTEIHSVVNSLKTVVDISDKLAVAVSGFTVDPSRDAESGMDTTSTNG